MIIISPLSTREQQRLGDNSFNKLSEGRNSLLLARRENWLWAPCWTPAWVAAALGTHPLVCLAEERTGEGWQKASGLAARQPARVLGDVARMPELIVVRCAPWCRAVGSDSLAGFLAPKSGPLGEEGCRGLPCRGWR